MRNKKRNFFENLNLTSDKRSKRREKQHIKTFSYFLPPLVFLGWATCSSVFAQVLYWGKLLLNRLKCKSFNIFIKDFVHIVVVAIVMHPIVDGGFLDMDTKVCAHFCVQMPGECIHKALLLAKFWFICLKWLRLTILLDVFHFFVCFLTMVAVATTTYFCCACKIKKNFTLVISCFMFKKYIHVYDEIFSDDIILLMGLVAVAHEPYFRWTIGTTRVSLMLLVLHYPLEVLSYVKSSLSSSSHGNRQMEITMVKKLTESQSLIWISIQRENSPSITYKLEYWYHWLNRKVKRIAFMCVT